ncbi:MAG: hypothetical protein AAF901_13985, partial [Bacteroidota bacterium]
MSGETVLPSKARLKTISIQEASLYLDARQLFSNDDRTISNGEATKPNHKTQANVMGKGNYQLLIEKLDQF